MQTLSSSRLQPVILLASNVLQCLFSYSYCMHSLDNHMHDLQLFSWRTKLAVVPWIVLELVAATQPVGAAN